MRLHAVGGLCNRLRAILSVWASGHVEVIWDEDEYVSGAHFLDVFRPIHGLDFVSAAGGWDVEAFAPAPGAIPGWENAYRALTPADAIQERLRRGPPRPYVACHIRRTDHVPNVDTHGGVIRPIEEYVRWAVFSRRPLYLATDNRETQAKVRSMYPDTWIGCELPESREEQGLTDHHRNGSLADAVTDLYNCAAAAEFLGSVGSSFTDTIETLRTQARLR
jgi:hypothetical protein